jgi:ribosome-binding factor A
MSQRTDRVADLLRSELAEIIRHELGDPRIGLATVSAVTVSRDLAHAEVLVSVLGEDDAREESVAVLVRARGHVRRLLARRVRLRTVPELAFRLDRGAEHSLRISEILEDLHGGD